eukprot:GFYU01006590.1.p1 GENE.GFYU01006590.1~~GFYU01006590.1.p1  ORF type:complete len:187 (-),score=45.29 GFYU01006590.1:138-698(-)
MLEQQLTEAEQDLLQAQQKVEELRKQMEIQREKNSHRRTVIVAMDESENSVNAFEWCMENLHAKEDRLVVLYSEPSAPQESPMLLAEPNAGVQVAAMHEHAKKEIQKRTQANVAKFRKLAEDFDVNIEVMVAAGDPRDKIVEAAEKLSAQVVVVGCRGAGMLRRALLGSVSSHCVHNLRCTVIVVR